jgi:hypothetical protein
VAIGKSVVTDAFPALFDVKNAQSFCGEIPSAIFFTPRFSCILFLHFAEPTSVDDWLAQTNDFEQNFDMYRDCEFAARGKILVVPIGPMRGGPDVDLLHDYLSAFFLGLTVEIGDSVSLLRIDGQEFACFEGCKYALPGTRERSHENTKRLYVKSHRQYFCSDFGPLLQLLARRDGVFCVLAITMCDLYLSDDDEFSMGCAYIAVSHNRNQLCTISS